MKNVQFKKHVLTGIAYMIPVVVAGGICLGISRIFGGVDIQEGSFAAALETIGNAAIGFTVPVIAAGIAYSISGRPGIAPGLASRHIGKYGRSWFSRRFGRWFFSWLYRLSCKNLYSPAKAYSGVDAGSCDSCAVYACNRLDLYVSHRNTIGNDPAGDDRLAVEFTGRVRLFDGIDHRWNAL